VYNLYKAKKVIIFRVSHLLKNLRNRRFVYYRKPETCFGFSIDVVKAHFI